MFISQENRGQGESVENKSELDSKFDQLTLMRRKKVALEPLMSTPHPVDEAKRIEKEYKDVISLIEEIEKDINILKERRGTELEQRFGNTSANNEDQLTQNLRAFGDLADADRIDAAKNKKIG